jgi:hypothetical protein
VGGAEGLLTQDPEAPRAASVQAAAAPIDPDPDPDHLERRSRRPLLPYPQASRAGAPVNRTRSPKLRSGGSEATHTCPGWGLTGFHLVRPSI